MPIKTSSGKWKWGNVERDSKKELVQTVYGIWKKNGSKGSFSDFLKGTHESIDESKLVGGELFFHGTRHLKDRLEKPTTFRPFFVTKDVDYALSYAEYRNSNPDSGIYLVKLNPSAKVFDPTNSEDFEKLVALDFWPQDVIDRLANGTDVLMTMLYASRSAIDANRDTQMAKVLKGSGAKTFRDYFCRQLKSLGYSMFKTREYSLGYSSNLVYGIFDVDGLESLVPIPFSVDKAKKIERMVKQHRPIESILRTISGEFDEDQH